MSECEYVLIECKNINTSHIQDLHIRTFEIHTFNMNYHTPVLLKEAIEGLQINPSGIYVDCTMGGAGHTKAILEKIGSEGTLIAFDQDKDAAKNVPNDKRIIFIDHNFKHIQRFLKLHQITAVDGILADLGVSSHQFDEGSRGFSIRYDALLDMRMDQRQTLTAFNIIQTYTEQQLHKLFEQYGEVTNSKTLAKTIVNSRNHQSLKTVSNFKQAISNSVKGNPNKYFAQVFQALRIAVNDEMKSLEALLKQVPTVLKTGGRAVFITFHSIEDRIVKNYFKRGKMEEDDENDWKQTEKIKHFLKLITKKPIEAGEEELKINPRARSAKLRIAEKK